MSHMKRAFLVVLLVGGCSFNPEIPGPPDVMGAWSEVYGMGDPPNIMATAAEEHRQSADWLLMPQYANDRQWAHALTHVWAIRQATAIGMETLMTIHDEAGAWDMLHGDPHHTQSVWMDNGQPGALEKQALEWFAARR